MIKKITDNLSTIVVLFALIGGFVGANNYLAKASDLKKTDERLNNYIIKDKIDFLQERVWKLEDRYRIGSENPREMPISVKEDLRTLKHNMEFLIKKLKPDEKKEEE